jgi:hypothetical protein
MCVFVSHVVILGLGVIVGVVLVIPHKTHTLLYVEHYGLSNCACSASI